MNIEMGRTKTTIRHTLHRLGMQAKANETVDALVSVSEGFVERVRSEELKDRGRAGCGPRTSNRVGKRHQATNISQK